MSSIIYNSFYQDIHYTNLKNIVFLFDKIIVPNDSMMYIFDEDSPTSDSRYITLIPNHVRDDIEFLRLEGAVEIPSLFQTSALDFPFLYRAVNDGANKIGHVATSEYALNEIFEAFDLDRKNREHCESINKIASALASYSVGHALTHSTFSFCENHFIYILGKLGMSSLYDKLAQQDRPKAVSIDQVRTNYVISELSKIYLPRYTFRTFEDALEARHQLATPLDDFRIAVNELANFEAADPWDPEFVPQMNSLIDRRIRPKIEAVHQEAKISIPRITKHSLAFAASMCLQSFLAPPIGTFLVGGTGTSLLQSLISESQRAAKVKDDKGLGLFLHIS